jgi:hypothetical protein
MKKTTAAFQLLVAAALVPGVAFAQAQAQAQDETPKPGFTAKEDRPRTGSNIKRDTVWGGGLPYDKTYAELTPDQQRMLKSRYLEMGEGDEPPYPLDGMGPLLKALGKANEIARDGLGKLELEVLVDATGTVTKVDVLQSPGAKLAQYAGHIGMLTKFKPAVCKGMPCAMGFPVVLNFVRR